MPTTDASSSEADLKAKVAELEAQLLKLEAARQDAIIVASNLPKPKGFLAQIKEALNPTPLQAATIDGDTVSKTIAAAEKLSALNRARVYAIVGAINAGLAFLAPFVPIALVVVLSLSSGAYLVFQLNKTQQDIKYLKEKYKV